jgi:hypothetical protein
MLFHDAERSFQTSWPWTVPPSLQFPLGPGLGLPRQTCLTQFFRKPR